MSNPQNPDFLQILPRAPLAEDMVVDTLLAYRDQLAQVGSNAPHLQAEMAWNNLEIGIATRSGKTVEAAFNTFRGLTDNSSVHLGYSALVDTRLAIASEPSFMRRLNPHPINRKDINSIYGQVGLVIADCLAFEAVATSTIPRKLPELVAYGALVRAKNEDNFPHPASPREKTGQGPDSHDFYTLRRDPTPQKTATLQVEEQNIEQAPAQNQETNAVSMLSLAGQAIRSCSEEWSRAIAGKGSPIAQGRRQLQYVAEQLVRESKRQTLKSDARQVLHFVTSHLHSFMGIDLPSRQSHPATLENTSLAEQLRNKFPID